MWVTGCLMELWKTLFAGRGKAVLAFPCPVNGVFHSAIACYPHFHDARHTDRSKPLPRPLLPIVHAVSVYNPPNGSEPPFLLPQGFCDELPDSPCKPLFLFFLSDTLIHFRCPPVILPRRFRSNQMLRPASRLRDGGASAFPCQRRSSCQSRTGTCISGALLCRTCH